MAFKFDKTKQTHPVHRMKSGFACREFIADMED